ncbi:MAG TPA: hypothetical protein V6D13_04530 [Halomicronema sp.]
MMLVAIGPMALILEIIDWRLEVFRTPFQLGIIILFSTFGAILAFVPYAYAYSFFLGDSPSGWPKNLPSPRSLAEALFGLSALTISSSIGVGVSLLFIRLNARHGLYFYSNYNFYGQEGAATIGAIAWFVSAAYLYQAKILTWRGMMAELKKKATDDLAANVTSSEDNPFSDFVLYPETTPKVSTKTSIKTKQATNFKTQTKKVAKH